TLIMRNLKGLENVISVSVVHPVNVVEGWEFTPYPGSTDDPVNHVKYLHELYNSAQPGYTGKVTVPVLWDKKTSCIVNNESSEIMRMFNAAFAECGANASEFCPPELQAEIDEVNAAVYKGINNAVYRS